MAGVGDLLAGRYRLQRQLGSGAIGVVWHALDERLQRPVAVKQLVPQPGVNSARAEEARQRAMREGRIAARLHHPNAIAVHDVTEHDGLPVLVMEYLPSRSLADALAEQGPLSPVAAVGIGVQAASALAAAHAAGIVHRDIKPGNVLLGEDGTVKITDFGISHAAGDVAVTQTGLLAGTPAYLTPEVARGQAPSPSSDVFSLGATLYAAVEGAPPFGDTAENTLALLHVVAAGQVAPPQRAGGLAPVLMSMLEVDPGRRPSPEQAREALLALAADHAEVDGRDEGADEDRTQPLAAVAAATTSVPYSRGGGSGTRLDARPVEHEYGRSDWQTADTVTPARLEAQQRRRLSIAAVVLLAVAAAGFWLAQLPSNQSATPPPAPSAQPVAPSELERVVSDYYALLPEHPGNAWTRLSPALQTPGPAQYESFWATVANVTIIAPPRTIGDNTVHVGIEVALPDGTTIREFHQLGMVLAGTTPLIHSDTLLHSERLAPPPPPPPPPSTPDKDGEGKGERDKKGEEGKEGEGN